MHKPDDEGKLFVHDFWLIFKYLIDKLRVARVAQINSEHNEVFIFYNTDHK